LLSLPPLVSRTRRALLLTGTLVFPFLVAVLAGGFGAFQRSVLNAAPELATLNECLVHHHELQREVTSGKLARKDDLDAFEIYISGRFGSLITNQTRWNNPVAQTVIAAPLRIEAEQIVNRVGCPEGAQLTDASRAVEKFFRKPPDIAAREALQQPNLLLGALAVCYGTTLIVVVIPCLVGSLLFRGGALTHLLGIVFVTGNGRPASRWRVAGRNLVAWLPFLMLPLAANTDLAFPLLLCLSSALAAVSVGLPARGLADRLAGTWPVPR
jgi:hypothetical protein